MIKKSVTISYREELHHVYQQPGIGQMREMKIIKVYTTRWSVLGICIYKTELEENARH